MKTLLLPFDELLAIFFKCIMGWLVLFRVYLSSACTFLWLFASIFSHERFTLIKFIAVSAKIKHLWYTSVKSKLTNLLYSDIAYTLCTLFCPYSILEYIYAQGFSVRNYRIWKWGALMRRIWTMPWCVKNFLSNHSCMCLRKRFWY